MEMHLVMFHRLLLEFQPRVVIFDPIGSLSQAGNRKDATAMLTRLLDFLKVERITALLTNLTSGDAALETTDVDISSTVDTWLLLRDLELGGERNRAIYILKSRGMAHSNQVREFLLTNQGIQLQDVYLDESGILTGSARQSQELRERAATLLREERRAGQERDWERKRRDLDTQITAMRKQFESDEEEARWAREQKHKRSQSLQADWKRLGLSRQMPPAGKFGRHRAGRIPSRKEHS
jgi:circadian clock protein KaiC